VQALVQEALEAVMTEAIAAARGESYRSGYYRRTLAIRVGTRRSSTELFERYQRSEKALVGRWRRCTCRACRRARSR
jgi:transposase-like protein